MSLSARTRPPLGFGRDVPQVLGAHRATFPGMESITLDVGIALGAVGSIIGTVIIVAIGLAGLILHSASRADRRMDRFEDGMAEFRAEMQRLAERQSHVEGRLDERGAAAD